MQFLSSLYRKIQLILVLIFPGVLLGQTLDSTCQESVLVRQIQLEGLQHTRHEVVHRVLNHHPGQPYHKALWQAERAILESLDLFTQVTLECQRQSDGQILVYHFQEMFQYLPAPAMKKTDQDGWMLGGALASLNFLGRDIRLEIQGRATVNPWMQAQELAFYASSPWLGSLPLNWHAEILRVDSWDPLRNFHDRSWILDGNGTWRFRAGRSPWGVSAHGGARMLEHTDLDSNHIWRNSGHEDTEPWLGWGWVYDGRDAVLNPRHGMYHEFRILKYGGFLGGDVDFWALLYDFRWAYSWGRTTFLLNELVQYRPGQQGVYDRLHHGGANTLRGYDADTSAHGSHEWVHNVEYRWSMIQRRPIEILGIAGFWALQLVAGVDGAFLWDEQKLPGWENYRASLYGGVHLVLPAIDRIRLEAGINPHDHTWNIAIGLFEKTTTQRWRSR